MALPYSITEKILVGVFVLILIYGFFSPYIVGEQQTEHELTESAGTSADALKIDLENSVHIDVACSKCHTDSNDVHTEHSGVTCSKCHDDLSEYTNENWGKSCFDCHDLNKVSADKYQIERKDKPITCSKCHEGAFVDYNQSIHSIYGNKGAEKPICLDCHAVAPHLILDTDDHGSPSNHEHSIEVCAECHEEEMETFEVGYHEEFYKEYERDKIPSCSDCHGDHNIYPASHSNSTLNKDNVDDLCSEKCHDFKTNPETVKSFIHQDGFEYFPLIGKLVLAATIIFCFAHLAVVFGMKKNK